MRWTAYEICGLVAYQSLWLEGAGPVRTDPRKGGKKEVSPACPIHFSPAAISPAAPASTARQQARLLHDPRQGRRTARPTELWDTFFTMIETVRRRILVRREDGADRALTMR